MNQVQNAQNASGLDQNLDNPSSFQSQQLQIMKRQNEIFERQESGRHNETLNQTEVRKSEAEAKVKVKAELIFKHARELNEKVSEVENWQEEPDLVISRAMKNVKEWEEKLNKNSELKEDMDYIIAANMLKT